METLRGRPAQPMLASRRHPLAPGRSQRRRNPRHHRRPLPTGIETAAEAFDRELFYLAAAASLRDLAVRRQDLLFNGCNRPSRQLLFGQRIAVPAGPARSFRPKSSLRANYGDGGSGRKAADASAKRSILARWHIRCVDGPTRSQQWACGKSYSDPEVSVARLRDHRNSHPARASVVRSARAY
jgi:hypothetical protein